MDIGVEDRSRTARLGISRRISQCKYTKRTGNCGWLCERREHEKSSRLKRWRHMAKRSETGAYRMITSIKGSKVIGGENPRLSSRLGGSYARGVS